VTQEIIPITKENTCSWTGTRAIARSLPTQDNSNNKHRHSWAYIHVPTGTQGNDHNVRVIEDVTKLRLLGNLQIYLLWFIYSVMTNVCNWRIWRVIKNTTFSITLTIWYKEYLPPPNIHNFQCIKMTIIFNLLWYNIITVLMQLLVNLKVSKYF
jgi:hypothetical protein